MNAALQLETEKLIHSWMQHDSAHLRDYLVATVEDPRYLDLVARGVLWATGHLKDDGTPAKGFGPGGK